MAATTLPRRGARRWLRESAWRHLLLWAALGFALFPILFVVSAAFNPLGTLSSSQLIPQRIGLDNATDLFRNTPFTSWYVNSLVISLVNAAVTVFLSALAAYAFSRFRFAGRRVGLWGILLVQMFPQFLAIVAIYLMFTTVTDYWPAVGFDTRLGLMLIYLGGALSVNTWMMKGFFDTIPKELDESAKVDGATHAQAFFRIMLPLVTPVLAIVGLLVFIGTVNEFLIASVFLRDPQSQTVAVGLYGLISGERNANFGVFAMGTLFIALPTIAVFWYLQRYIVEGLTSGSVKG